MPKKVTILKDSGTGEYRVPGPAGTEAQAYYTDDRNDAVGTARSMWKGHDISITFKSVPDFDKFLNNPRRKSIRVPLSAEHKELMKGLRKAKKAITKRVQFYNVKVQFRRRPDVENVRGLLRMLNKDADSTIYFDPSLGLYTLEIFGPSKPVVQKSINVLLEQGKVDAKQHKKLLRMIKPIGVAVKAVRKKPYRHVRISRKYIK